MQIFRCIISDWYKTKNNLFRPIIIVIPIIYSLFILWYVSNFKDGDIQIRTYKFYFEGLSAIIPIFVSIFAGYISLQEENAGNFIRLIMQPVSRITLYISKILLFMILTTICSILSLSTILIGLKYIFNLSNINLNLFFEGIFYIIINSLILYSIHLLISFAYGIGTSIAIGGVGFLTTCIIGLTSIGDNVWKYVPWAWGARLCQIPILKLIAPTSKNQIQKEYLVNEMSIMTLISIACFLLISLIGIVWFCRWEGRKTYE
ncbi:MAG: lantibiotic immunity ABC transporter MutG family permease subunit [Clostridiales bacterium]